MNRKIIITVLVFLYCLYYLSSLDSWHFIDYVNLITHEAGHVVFSIFGYFLSILGGTLLQLIVPTIFIGYFAFNREQYSASLLLYWLGINLLNISVYAGDALKMQLPLLTGDVDTHDWNQLLFSLGWLRHTETINHLILGLGITAIIIALLWGIYSSRLLKENRQ